MCSACCGGSARGADERAMRVLGIDPGLRLTGYGCIEQVRGGRAARVRVVEAGVIRLDGNRSVSERLVELEADLTGLIGRVRPDVVAVEQLYSHYAHPTTAIVMGHARGIILLVVQKGGVRLLELRATEVKKSATGFGHASKGQMQRAMQDELGLAELPKPPDVADALAIALCGLRREAYGPGVVRGRGR